MKGKRPASSELQRTSSKKKRLLEDDNTDDEKEAVAIALSKGEESDLDVLNESSIINGFVFLPWSEKDIATETFSFLGELFTDPDGLLSLTVEQKRLFSRWARPHQFMPRDRAPKLFVGTVSGKSVKQSVVGDCNFLAAAIVAANYENRFKKAVITKCACAC